MDENKSFCAESDVLIAVVDKVSSRVSTGDMLLTLAVPLERAAVLAPFLSKIGKHVGVAFADLDKADTNQSPPHTPKSGAHPYGESARQLYACGVFRSQALIDGLGMSRSAGPEEVSRRLANLIGYESIGDASPSEIRAHLKQLELEWVIPSSFGK